jgi:hypothetical protein
MGLIRQKTRRAANDLGLRILSSSVQVVNEASATSDE